jgi:hypothetical protein
MSLNHEYVKINQRGMIQERIGKNEKKDKCNAIIRKKES